MATFSVNQSRHVYVVKELKSPKVTATDSAGAIAVVSDNEKKHLHFEYMGAGGQVRSPLIKIDSISHAKATDADAMAQKLKRYKVVLDPTVNGGLPVGGQDYLLRVAFRNYIGISEADQYFKYGTVRGLSGMTASDFYKTLGISLAKNFSREVSKLVKIYLTVSATPTEINEYTKPTELTGTYDGVIIEEAPQEWTLGTFSMRPVNFTLQPDIIKVEGEERIWGVVTEETPVNTVDNGRQMADFEYFYMGERGDIYRNVGFPHVINTEYLIDPNQKYSTIDIHFAFSGSNEAVQKSESDITLIIPKAPISGGGEDPVTGGNDLANSIIKAINTATGLNIATLA